MMNNNHSKELNEINQYFRKFVSHYKDYIHFDEITFRIAKQIANTPGAPFDSDWNYLMTLVQLIEVIYCRHGFISQDNYFRFELENNERIQDKGSNKMDAIYSCCHRVLKEYWKDEAAPHLNRGCEPFE